MKGFDLSYESLVSYETHEQLRNLRLMDPMFHSQLSRQHKLPEVNGAKIVEEPDEQESEDKHNGIDKSNVGLDAVVSAVLDEGK